MPNNLDVSASSVNYEEAPLALAEVDGVEYRVDAGQGSAVAVSQRQEGSWDWSPLTGGKWDGRRLRAKSLDHAVVTALGLAIGAAMREQGEQSFS